MRRCIVTWPDCHQLHANGYGCMILSHSMQQCKLLSVIRVQCKQMIGGSCHLGALHCVVATPHDYRHDSHHDDTNHWPRPHDD